MAESELQTDCKKISVKSKAMKKFTILFFIVSFLNAKSQFIKLHDFSGADGSNPSGGLITDGTYLYGMTEQGGVGGHSAFGAGVIFRILPDGSGYQKIVNLADITPKDPWYPICSPYSDGTFLYGTTEEDDPDDHGTGYGAVFKVKFDGSQYTRLYEFTGGFDGAYPQASLVSDGTFLYGTTALSSIFKLKPDGTSFSVLSNFQYLESALLYNNNYLYGTSLEGTNGNGAIFKIKTDGSDFTKLYDCHSTTGIYPNGSLVLDGTYLYGTTEQGGSNNKGVVFKAKSDGTEYDILVNFSGVNGSEPKSSLIFDGTFLYGMTESGGANGWGIIYKVKPDGSNFVVMHNLQISDGCCSEGSLLLDGTFLYGSTNRGGANGKGTIFKININMTDVTEEVVTIFPNPSINQLYVKHTKEKGEIYIYDVTGKLLLQQASTDGETNIDCQNISDGIYFLQYQEGTLTTNIKFIKFTLQ